MKAHTLHSQIHFCAQGTAQLNCGRETAADESSHCGGVSRGTRAPGQAEQGGPTLQQKSVNRMERLRLGTVRLLPHVGYSAHYYPEQGSGWWGRE